GLVPRDEPPFPRTFRARPLPPAVAGDLRRRGLLASHDRPAHSSRVRIRGDRDGLRPDHRIRPRPERRRGGRRPRPSGERLLGDRRRRHPLSPDRAYRTDRRGPVTRALVVLSLVLLVFRVLSAAFVVTQPGFTDAYYYVDVAQRLPHGQGLTADFIWNFLEAPRLEALPVPSHRFWMPLATVVQAGGIVALEPVLGTFRSAQAAIIAVAAFVPAAAYVSARSIGASSRAGLVAAAVAGLGGFTFAPAWVTLDSFAIAALVGTLFFVAFARAAAGDVRAGAIAGALVGLLFLARAWGVRVRI